MSNQNDGPPGSGVGLGVGVGPAVPANWISKCALLDVASSELKVNPSLLGVSIAIDKKAPSLEATADVRSTSAQLLRTPPGENVVMSAPLGGAFAATIDDSCQLSVKDFRLKVPPEPLVTHIRSFAETTFCPASDCRLNFK